VAASITTQADLLTYTSATDNEIGRLETERMRADNWAAVHTRAWTEVKELLLARRPSIEEADLDDTTELEKCTALMVLYQAYEEAELGTDDAKARKRFWFRKMRREFARVTITSGGMIVGPESFGSRRGLRG